MSDYAQTVHGQDNPFGDASKNTDDSDPFGTNENRRGVIAKVTGSRNKPRLEDPELKAKEKEIAELNNKLAIAKANRSEDVEELAKQLEEALIAFEHAKDIARINKGVEAAKNSGDTKMLRQQLEELMEKLEHSKQTLRESDNRFAELIHVNEALKERIKAVEAEELREGKKKDYSEKAYMELLAELLSKDEASQLIGLQHIYSSHFNASEEGLAHLPANNNIIHKIRSLTESKNQEVRSAAIKDLILVHPNSARDLGFQVKGFWRPVTEQTKDTNRISDAFSIPIDFVYEDMPIADFVDEVRNKFAFDFAVDKSIDPETLLTIDIRGQNLASGLDEIAEKLGLVVCQTESMVKLLPPTHPDARSSLTYNVRGLLRDDVTLDKLEQHAELQLGENSKVRTMGDKLLVVDATLKEQRKVSVALGALSPITR